MKVLFLTAYFPPCDFGWGYMRICEQVADGFAQAGHEVAVLTSAYRHGDEFKAYPVHRLLPLDPDWHVNRPAALQFFWGRRRREKQAVADLRRVVATVQPDVIFVWHAHGLPRLILQAAERMPQILTVYYFANYLPEMPDEYIPYWQSLPNNPVARLLKGAAARVALGMLAREGKPVSVQYNHSISVSHYVRDRLLGQKLIGADAAVIPNGVDVTMFSGAVRPFSANCHFPRLVIAGRVAPEKGIHTVLTAMGQLHQKDALGQMRLTVVGDGPVEYRQQLEAQVDGLGIRPYVQFTPPVPIEQMPEIYADQDILLLPSEWHEPLSCTMLEAMAAGLMVIGTTTGGSGEALAHEQSGLVFAPGDADGLVVQLRSVMQNRELVLTLAAAGRQKVIKEFDINTVVSRLEQHLQHLLADSRN